jgi:hypothetical protein
VKLNAQDQRRVELAATNWDLKCRPLNLDVRHGKAKPTRQSKSNAMHNTKMNPIEHNADALEFKSQG